MDLDFLFHPATFYATALLSLLVSVYLFASLKIEMARARSASDAPVVVHSGDEAAIRGLKSEIDQLKDMVVRLEAAAPARVSPNGDLSLTRRAQALRMHGRGEPVASIAAALETPDNEIALLLKVHEITKRVS